VPALVEALRIGLPEPTPAHPRGLTGASPGDDGPVRVAVIGLGMIGGSVALRLARAHDVIGWDADPATRERAATAGLALAAGVEDVAAGADVAVVATPPDSVRTVLTALSTTDCPVLTDVGSVKSPVLAAARDAGLADRFVGGHPMAGTERTGFAAADPALLDGAAWVLCVEGDTDLTAWLRTAELVTGAGCQVVPCGAPEHDDAQARISGLPHLLAVALAMAGRDGGPLAAALAAGSFRDGTRVAGSRPEFIAALCDGNATALARVLDETLARLDEARTALRTGGTVEPLAAAGHAARRAWSEPVPTVPETLDARAAGFRADLRDLGAAGGSVHAVHPDGTLHCRRPER
jgi:prephenate dehydrogenase